MRRLRSALLFIGSLGAVVGAFLLSSSARPPRKIPFVSKSGRGQALVVPLVRGDGPRGSSLHRIDFFSREPRSLLAHPEIQIFLSLPAKGARLRWADLRVVGTPCRYEASGGARLVDGEPLALRRGSACTEPAPTPTGQLQLTAELEGRDDLGVWSFAPEPGDAEASAIRASSAPDDTAPLLRGHFVDYPETAPRVRLLNYVWQISPWTSWLWILLSAAALLALAGLLVFPMRRLSAGTALTPVSFSLRGALGAACFAGALGLSYAVVAPPLSGPDEPYHLLGFAELNGEASLPAGLAEWMKLTHFHRIRGHPTERFRVADVGNPLALEDPLFRATEVAMRSASVAALWGITGRLLHDQPAPRTLLAVRILNAALFAAAVGLGTGLAMACSPVPYPQLVCLPFLFVPTLPFFAMHFSETALLTSAYVLLGSSVAVMFLDGPRAHWAGFPLGLSTALMLAGGRSPWPLAAVVAVVLGGRVLLGPSGRQGELRAAVVFWAGFALGGSAFYLLLNDEYRVMLLRYAAFAPAGLRSAGRWLIQQPLGMVGLAALAGTAEVSLRPPRLAVAGAWAHWAGAAVRWAGFALVGAVILSLVGSLFLPYPQLELEPARPLSARDLLIRTLATTATMFRLRDPNFLLFSTFWAGFGWLDTMPDPVFLSALALLTAVCLVGLLLHLAHRRDVRRFLWLLALGLGSTLALVIFALSIHNLPMALQGRYLIGWYLPVLSVIGSWAALAEAPTATATRGLPAILGRVPRPVALLALSGLVHTYCLCFILWRYF